MWQKRRSPRPKIILKKSLQQQKAVSEKANSNHCLYRPRPHHQVSSRQSAFTRPNLNLSNTNSPSGPRLVHNSASTFAKISGFCEGRVINRCSFICLLGSWASSKLLAAVLSVGCSSHRPLPQFPHKLNNYSMVVKVWKPFREKCHYLGNYLNTKMKLIKKNSMPSGSCRQCIAIPIPCLCKGKKIPNNYAWYKGASFGFCKEAFSQQEFLLREETAC